MIRNKEKEISIDITLYDLGMIITGLKMSNAFESVIDEEIEIKYNRGMKSKSNRKI